MHVVDDFVEAADHVGVFVFDDDFSGRTARDKSLAPLLVLLAFIVRHALETLLIYTALRGA